jgi:soluble lytic murein transglycosylase
VASFFARPRDWKTAAHYAQILAEQFPYADAGREGNWRVAWTLYLVARQQDKAREALLGHLTRYPASPHVPAALYWLGRLSEDQKAFACTRALYEFLSRRFVPSYYGVLASRRLQALPPASAEESDESVARFSLVALERVIPHLGPHPLLPCAALEVSDDLRPYLTLRELSLDDLAEQYLDAKLSKHPGSLDLILALSRSKAEQSDYNAALTSAKKLVPNVSEYQFAELPEEIWGLLYPRAFRTLIERQARANGLSPYVVMGLIRQESGFNPQATSWADARGLMQILPQTAGSSPRRRRAAGRKLYNPAYNVRFGCRYLRDLLRTYNGDLQQALAAYHAGTPNVRAWLEGHQFREPGEFMEAIPIPATRAYVEAVLRDAEIYRQLMTGTAKFRQCS